MGIYVDHDGAGLAAEGQRKAGALDGGHLGANEVVAVIVERLLGQRVAGDAELQNGHARGVVAQDAGRRGAEGQRVQHGLRGGRQLRDSGFDFGIGMEEDLDNAEARQRLRLHVLDVVNAGGKGALAADRYHVRHVLRRDAAVRPHDADNGNIDFGENVGGHAQDGERAERQHQQRHDDKSVGPAKGEGDYPHKLCLAGGGECKANETIL